MIFALAMIPILILMVKLSTLWDFNVSKLMTTAQISESINMPSDPEINKISFMKYSRDKAMEIWGNHPFLGVGPGMFGGVISVKFHSHIYEEYGYIAQEILQIDYR